MTQKNKYIEQFVNKFSRVVVSIALLVLSLTVIVSLINGLWQSALIWLVVTLVLFGLAWNTNVYHDK